MRQPFYRSPKVHKWGLYACLLGSLGFNLSMNPQQYNLARNGAFFSADLAQTVAPVKTGFNDVVMNNGKAFKVSVFEIDGKRTAQISAMTPEGKACTDCTVYKPITSSIENAIEFKTELDKTLTEMNVATAPPKLIETKETKVVADVTAGEEKAAVASKPGEALSISEKEIKELAEKCENKSGDSNLSCHKNQIIKISKALKNSNEQASFVTDYFKEYMLEDIKSGLSSNRTVSQGGDDMFTDEDSDSYEMSREIVRDLVKELESQNGAKVRNLIARLSTNSIYIQADHARTAMLASFRGSDVIQDRAQFQSGFNILNGLKNEATDLKADLADAFADNKTLTKKDNANFRSGLNSSFTPMDAMFNEINQKYFSMAMYPGNLPFTKVGVEALQNITLIPGGVNAGPTLPAGSSNLPANIGDARSQGRSYNGTGLLLTLPDQQDQSQGQQGRGGCNQGLVMTATGCMPSGQQGVQQQQVPGGYQSPGLPAPRAATNYPIRGSHL